MGFRGVWDVKLVVTEERKSYLIGFLQISLKDPVYTNTF
jgi:hypothetical protein